MIRTEREYRETLRRIEEGNEFARAQRDALIEQSLTPEQVDGAMEPLLSFQAQYQEEARRYERAKRGDIEPVTRFSHIGRLLIALRIASGLTQRELAQRLAVAESQISRDERHEYYGVTSERADRVLESLGAGVRIAAQSVQRQSLSTMLVEKAPQIADLAEDADIGLSRASAYFLSMMVTAEGLLSRANTNFAISTAAIVSNAREATSSELWSSKFSLVYGPAIPARSMYSGEEFLPDTAAISRELAEIA